MTSTGKKAQALELLRRQNYSVPNYFIIPDTQYDNYHRDQNYLRSEAFYNFIHGSLTAIGEGPWIIRPNLDINNQSKHQDEDSIQSYYPLVDIEEVLHAISLMWNVKSMGLIIQSYISGEFFGRLHTMNIKTGEDKELYVEIQRTPFSSPDPSLAAAQYRLSWFGPQIVLTGEDVDRAPLNTQQLVTLRELGQSIHSLFRSPQTVHFIIRNERVFILSCRNIDQISFTENFGTWVTSDFRDNEHGSALALPLMSSLYNSIFSSAIETFLSRIGLSNQNELEHQPWHQIYYGRFYWNVGRFKKQCTKIPFGWLQSIAQVLNTSAASFLQNQPPPLNFQSIWNYIKLQWRMRFFFKETIIGAQASMLNFEKSLALWDNESVRLQDFTQLSETWKRLIYHYRMIESKYLELRFYSLLAQARFEKTFAFYRKACPTLNKWDLLSELGDIDSISAIKNIKELSLRLKVSPYWPTLVALVQKGNPISLEDLGRLHDSLAIPLREFFHRYAFFAENDLDLRVPRWGEDASFPLQVIVGLNQYNSPEPGNRNRPLHQKASHKVEVYSSALQRLKDSRWLTPLILIPWGWKSTLRHIEELRSLLLLQGQLRSLTARSYSQMRSFLLNLSNHPQLNSLSESDILFYSSHDDLSLFLDGQMCLETLNIKGLQSKNFLNGYLNFSPPLFLTYGSNPLNLSFTLGVADPISTEIEKSLINPTLVGLSVSQGRVRGRARIIKGSLHDFDFREGDILVAPQASLGWLPLYAVAGGVVSESGSALSPSAVIAREYGIPTVFAVDTATEQIKEGDEIEIDGTCGEVYLA